MDSSTFLLAASAALNGQEVSLKNYKISSSSKYAQITFYNKTASFAAEAISGCRWSAPLSNGQLTTASSICPNDQNFDTVTIFDLQSDPYSISKLHVFDFSTQGISEIYDVYNQSQSDGTPIGYSYILGADKDPPNELITKLNLITMTNENQSIFPLLTIDLEKDYGTAFLSKANLASI